MGVRILPNPENPEGPGDPAGNVGSGILGRIFRTVKREGGREKRWDPALPVDGIPNFWDLGGGRGGKREENPLEWDRMKTLPSGKGKGRKLLPVENQRHHLHFPPFSQTFCFSSQPFPAFFQPVRGGKREGQGKGKSRNLLPVKNHQHHLHFPSFFSQTFYFSSQPFPTLSQPFSSWSGMGRGKSRKREGQEFYPIKSHQHHLHFSSFFPKPIAFHPNFPNPFPAILGWEKGAAGKKEERENSRAGKGKGRNLLPLKNHRHHLRFPSFFPQPFRFPSRPFSSQSGWLRSGNSSSR